jgi:hypothetical protein
VERGSFRAGRGSAGARGRRRLEHHVRKRRP